MTARHYTLAATALGSSLAFIDASAVIVALPTMQKALHLGLAGEQWVFLAYSLALASLYLVGGALGDRFGHQKVFRYGVLGFALASALAGLAPNGAMLILARVLQGVSGAFVTTNSLAWLRSVYQDQAGKAVGLWTSLTGVSTIIAPPLGGVLTQYLNWRWIFYINLPLAALVIFWSTRAGADKPDPAHARPLDPLGAGLIAAGLGFLTYFLVQGAKTGFSPLWWSLLIGGVGLIGFLIVEKRLAEPMLPLKLFKIRNFAVANLQTVLIYGALNGLFVYFTLYLQFLGLSPLASSLFLIPTSIVLILLASYFGGLADRQGPRKLLIAGPALIGLGSLIFTTIHSRPEVWLRGSIGVVFFSVGLAMLVAPITAAALKAVPSNFAGIASGVNNSASRIGGLIAVAVIGLIISVIFFNVPGGRGAVPLDVHQQDPALRRASERGFRVGTYIVAGLAFGSAVVAGLGFKNERLKK